MNDKATPIEVILSAYETDGRYTPHPERVIVNPGVPKHNFDKMIELEAIANAIKEATWNINEAEYKDRLAAAYIDLKQFCEAEGILEPDDINIRTLEHIMTGGKETAGKDEE